MAGDRVVIRPAQREEVNAGAKMLYVYAMYAGIAITIWATQLRALRTAQTA